MASGFPRLTQVLINGTDVTSALIDWDFDPSNQQTVKKIDLILSKSVYALEPLLETSPNDLSIVVKRGVSLATEDTVFTGETINAVTIGTKIFISANDGLYDAVRRNVTKSFSSNIDPEAGKMSEMFKTLINDFTSLTADSTSVQDSGTEILLKRFICNHADVLERTQIFAEILQWQIYQNPTTAKIHFEPQGFPSQSTTLTVGDNIVQRPKWVRDGSKKIKKLEVFGGPTESGQTESFNGDAAETDFTLGNLPSSIIKITVDGVEQIGGIEDQDDGTADYFVDFVNSTITFVSAPGSGTNNVVIQYKFLSPIALVGENTIAEGRDVTDRRPELITVQDVENFLTGKLARFSVDFLSTTARVTNVTDLEVGQSVRVIDKNENIDDNFIVTKINKHHPYRFDTISITNAPLVIENWEVSMEDRVRRIEERLLQEESILLILKQFNRTIQIGRRYSKVSKIDHTGATYGIYNHPQFGVYGTALYGTTADFPAEVLRFMQQGEDFYLETFVDTDFEDSAGTATWGSGSVSFTSGQVAQSSEIDLRHGIITKALLNSTEASGSFTYEMTADGTNFETVTPGTLHNFTNTGTDLRWRATENAASTGEITQIEISEYHL